MFRKLTLLALLLSAVFVAPSRAALIINEVDSDTVNTPTTDVSEFMELYDTSGTSVPLDGYSLIFYNGNNATFPGIVYLSIDLDGKVTRPNGYFVAGSVAAAPDHVIAGNTIQNGGDAIALVLGDAADFPNGQSVTAFPATATLIDAVVYDTGVDSDGDDLVAPLLLAGGVVDEFGRDAGVGAFGAVDSIGRLPNASGGLRDTTTWSIMVPTPGLPNSPVVPEPATLGLLAMCTALLCSRRGTRG